LRELGEQALLYFAVSEVDGSGTIRFLLQQTFSYLEVLPPVVVGVVERGVDWGTEGGRMSEDDVVFSSATVRFEFVLLLPLYKFWSDLATS